MISKGVTVQPSGVVKGGWLARATCPTATAYIVGTSSAAKLPLRRRPADGAARAGVGRLVQLLALPQDRLAGRLLSGRCGDGGGRDGRLYLGRPDDRHPSLPHLRLRHPLEDLGRGFRADGRPRAAARRLRCGGGGGTLPGQCRGVGRPLLIWFTRRREDAKLFPPHPFGLSLSKPS